MQQAVRTMLKMQKQMNRKVHPEWESQNFAWYRAIWIECAELMDHQGYKWWKHHNPELEQVRLEVIDIWHFGLSALLGSGRSSEEVAAEVQAAFESWQDSGADVHAATEALAAFALNERGFSVALFRDLMQAVGLDFDQLFKSYVGKNVLNAFRQDHGYKQGHYQKTWDGREDNAHLVEVLEQLDARSADFDRRVYSELEQRYRSLCGEPAA